jgi:hypothetical protein
LTPRISSYLRKSTFSSHLSLASGGMLRVVPALAKYLEKLIEVEATG